MKLVYLRYLALKGLSHPSLPPYNVVRCLNGGGVWVVLFSEVTPFKDDVSTIYSQIVATQD